jgi:hypothetical protein
VPVAQSVSGTTNVNQALNSPSKGPHCPTVASTVYPPARLLSVEWIFDTHASSSATDAKISTDRKILKYRGPVVLVVALMIKPIPARVAARAQNGPRILNLSDSQQNEMTVKKQKMYGGADSPWDWMRVKVPISAMMVGTKRGREAKETLLQDFLLADGPPMQT